MRNRRNYYRVLHVQPDAPPAVLKSSYRALMLSLAIHPDRGGEHWNAALINEAYAVLSDPHRRAEYDRSRRASRQGTEGQTGSGSDAPDVRKAVDSGNGSPEPCCVFCGSERGSVSSAPADAVCVECRSPLTPAGGPQFETSGRRAARRVSKEGGIRFYTHWPQASSSAGQIVDLSPGGLSFRSSKPIAQFQIVKIEGSLLDAVARVVSCRDTQGSFTVGVQFYTVHFHNPRGTFLSTRA